MKQMMMVLMLALAVPAGALTLAYCDADSAAVHDVWPIERVRLGAGARCVIGAYRDSGYVHMHQFNAANEALIRDALAPWCVFEADSVTKNQIDPE